MTVTQVEPISRIAESVAAFAGTEGGDRPAVRRIVTEALQSQMDRQIVLAQAAGGTPDCRITKVTVSCNAEAPQRPDVIALQRPPGPAGPISWGGSECFTIRGCTVCYEYECRAVAVE